MNWDEIVFGQKLNRNATCTDCSTPFRRNTVWHIRCNKCGVERRKTLQKTRSPHERITCISCGTEFIKFNPQQRRCHSCARKRYTQKKVKEDYKVPKLYLDRTNLKTSAERVWEQMIRYCR